jgi:hypothetical protein
LRENCPSPPRQAAAIGINLLAKAVDEEYGETRDALLDADPEQWSRINGA